MKPREVGVCMLLGLVIGTACGSCSDNGNSAPTKSRIQALERWAECGPKLLDRLQRLYQSVMESDTTDKVKWQCTQVMFDGSYKPATWKGTEVQYRVMDAILEHTRWGEVWSEHYAGITAHVEFTARDLERLGQSLGSGERNRTGEQRYKGNGIFVFIEKYDTSLTHGELARRWIKHLVGQEFDDRQAFDHWFERNRTKLAWDREMGRFLLSGSPQS